MEFQVRPFLVVGIYHLVSASHGVNNLAGSAVHVKARLVFVCSAAKPLVVCLQVDNRYKVGGVNRRGAANNLVMP
jgi:hypothetical protein